VSINTCVLVLKSKRICGANLSEAAFLAHSAVLETADFAGIRVGGAEPSFKARLVYERHRTAAVAWRQKNLADARLVTDPAYWAACRATNITTGNYRDESRHSHCQQGDDLTEIHKMKTLRTDGDKVEFFRTRNVCRLDYEYNVPLIRFPFTDFSYR